MEEHQTEILGSPFALRARSWQRAGSEWKGKTHLLQLSLYLVPVETEYYRNTNIFPIMHSVVIKRSIYEMAPWVAVSMYEAFVKAKADALQRHHHTGTLFR